MILLLVLAAVFIELVWAPRFDFTRDKKLLLWYGITHRRYVKIF